MPRVLLALLETISFFSTPTIDVEPELLADAVHQGVGLVVGAVGTQDQKLVPAHPHGDVVGGDRLLDDIGHPLQQQVAILVAQGVVGPL